MHQVNLEYLASVVQVRQVDGVTVAFPDTLVGTDSHTTMINGLGVLGWGVGGIEAEAVMLGQPLYILTPQVVGFKLTERLPEGTTATDLVLTVTQMLRARGVVDKFVEFFGPGLSSLSLPDRATVQPKQRFNVRAVDAAGGVKEFQVVCRIDTPVEVEYYRNGGILQTVLRQMMKG